jgi:hypothetical protein
MENEEYD